MQSDTQAASLERVSCAFLGGHPIQLARADMDPSDECFRWSGWSRAQLSGPTGNAQAMDGFTFDGGGMPKVRLHNPKTGTFVWVDASACEPDGPLQASTAPSAPAESAPAGPTPNASAPSNHAEPGASGSSSRARRPPNEWDKFWHGSGTEAVDREDL